MEELRVCEAEGDDDALPLWTARRVYIAVDRDVAVRQPGVVARSTDLVDERRGPLLSPGRVVDPSRVQDAFGAHGSPVGERDDHRALLESRSNDALLFTNVF